MPTSPRRKTAAVATPHPAAADAGRQILLRGGNAVDAAVGAMLACCVAVPGSVGIGGYGGSMVAYLARDGKTVALDFDSCAPKAYRSELFQDERNAYQVGYLSLTVPAVVAGLSLAVRSWGMLPWGTVLQPAITLAEKGVLITEELQHQLNHWANRADVISRRGIFPDGTVPEAGSCWVQRDLARMLRRLAEEGPEVFYQGDIPQTIVRQVRANGGILAEDDFKRCQAGLVEPLGVDYRGYRVVTPPLPSGGLTSLQILKTLEQFPLAKLPPWGAEFIHLFAESAKLAWQDRVRYLGDPDVTSVPVDRLLSEETARVAAARIRQGEIGREGGMQASSPSHTVNVLAADAAGNMVSLTATHGSLFGSTVAIDGLGLIMGHGMSRFDLTRGSPNAPAACKRMVHNMAPTVLLGPDLRAWAAVGLPGGPKIVTVTAQLVVNLVDFHATPAEAVHAGRVHVGADEPVAVSSAVSDVVIQQLEALGHTTRRGQDVGGPPNEIGGQANALRYDPNTGAVAVASQAGEESIATVEV